MPNKRNPSRRSAKKRTKSQRDVHSGVFGKMLIMLAVVAAVVLGVAIFFQINTVEVQGNRIYSAEQVEKASGLEVGDNLVMVNRAEVTGSIEAQLPYIQSVSVGLILPDTVVIKVQESEVAGLVKADIGSSWYINSKGRILGSSVDGFRGQVIELNGFTVTAPQAGQQAVASENMEESMQAALKVMETMDGSGLMDRVTSVDTSKSFDILLYCGDQYEIRFGGSDELDYKVWYLRGVLEQLEPYQKGIIDLTLSQERAARFIPWVEKEVE